MKECQSCRRCFSDEFNNCPDDGEKLIISLRGSPSLEGRYQLERRLGDGGMGIVYKAQHSYLKTTHAIKVILPDLVGHDPMFSTRFRQEAMIAAAIRHPNIVQVTDFGVAQEILPFLVMEFIKGKSLHDIFIQRGTLPPEISLQIISAIAAGVGAAHRQGIVHRDLKPLNIMLQDDKPIAEAVKILDFGLAKIRSEEMFGSFVQAQTTGLMGSPLYMAPEQWSDEAIDSRADIYSIGIILYQMLAGDVPFKGSSLPSIMRRHLMSEPPSFASLGVQVPERVEAVVLRALEKNPADRFATVEEFLTDLRDAIVTTELTRRFENTLTPTETLTMRRPSQIASQLGETRPLPSIVDVPRETAEIRTPTQEDAERLAQEYEEAQRRAEEARQRAELAAKRRAEKEVARKLAEEEAARKRAEEAELRRREEEETRRRAALEAARKLLEEEEARKATEEAERRRVEEEMARQRAKDDADRIAKEIAVLQQRAEIARQQAEEEARKRTEEELARKQAEEKAERLAREVQDAQLRAEEARRRSEEETHKRAEEEAQRKKTDEEKARKRAEKEALRLAEVEAAGLAAKEEADRLAREVAEAQRRAEEARLRTEEEARKRVEEEAARKRAEEEAKRLAREVEDARKRVEEEQLRKIEEGEALQRAHEDAVRKGIEEELQRRAEEVAKKWAEEEAERRLAEEEVARKRAKEDAKRFAEQATARKRAEEEASRLAREIEEAERRAKEAQLKAEQEAKVRAEENERRRAEEEAVRQRAKEEAERLAREVEAARLRAEEARVQAEEEARKRTEEETARRLAEEKAQLLEHEVREAQRRAEEARKRVEQEALAQAQHEEQRRKQEEALRAAEMAERQRLLEELQLLEQEKRQRDEAIRAAELALAEERRKVASLPDVSTSAMETLPSQPGVHPTNPHQSNIGASFSSKPGELPVTKPSAKRALPWLVAGTVILPLILAAGGYAIYRATRPVAQHNDTNTNKKNIPTNLLLIPGGSFMMGRNDVNKDTQSNEWPAHQVTLKSFLMDRTEVTNAEYLEFVNATRNPAPDYWSGNKPPAGREQWPVTNVSLDDARVFAAWRSTRDGLTYRLPTEEEWEFAARGGSKDLLYPWGNTWYEDRANLGTGAGNRVDFPTPVGSYPQGASASGVMDLIGNVWEWTSSEASFYPGNPATVRAEERDWFVIRGGGHQSMYPTVVKSRGSREFPATHREWTSRTEKASTLGFRLVADAP
jgi:formylglycine-generating enzyme required for sulfatase activity/serine/threonine protein kinase